MPELPDVEMMRRYIERTSLGQKITGLSAKDTRLLKITESRLQDVLIGCTFNNCRRHGKFAFVETDKGPVLVLHFGMSGNLQYITYNENEPEHTKMLIGFENGYRLAYISVRKLGRIDLAEDIESFVKSNNIGLDAVNSNLSAKDFRKILGRGRGAIKSALMDQSKIAGLGNVYSDEILFQAGVHPKQTAGNLDDAAIKELFRKTRHVMRIALERDADSRHFPDSWIIKRREEGAVCPVCRGRVAKIKVAGRTCYFCPVCQKDRR